MKTLAFIAICTIINLVLYGLDIRCHIAEARWRKRMAGAALTQGSTATRYSGVTRVLAVPEGWTETAR